MDAFNFGPFTFSPGQSMRVAGSPARQWSMTYGEQMLAQHVVPATATQGEIIGAFAEDRAQFERDANHEHRPERISLIDFETGDEVAYFLSYSTCSMTPGIIDDRSRYWLRSADRLYSRAVTLAEFAQVAADESVPALAWITGLLPDAVLTSDPSEWRAPTSWEIRHLVGEGSFTGMSGAKAAAMIGVTPQNFRKYTARDGASTRQSISYAMWHLLLHKLGVQKA